MYAICVLFNLSYFSLDVVEMMGSSLGLDKINFLFANFSFGMNVKGYGKP